MLDLVTDHLLAEGKLTHEQVDRASLAADERGVPLSDALVQLHLVDRSDVLQAEAAIADIPLAR